MSAAVRYWLVVFPHVCLELRRWRRRALRIANPLVRDAALAALDKRSNMEGAAAFAAIGARRHCVSAVRALVAFQALYNHADMTAERFAGVSIERAREAHEPLLAALDASGPPIDASDPRFAQDADAEYVDALVDACRAALRRLPSSAAIALPAQRAAARIVAFQSLSVGRHGELEGWAHEVAPASSALRWWEAAASAGSSLGVHALIAAAASSSLDAETVTAIDDAYFPTIGALHSLLDSLVDLDEDTATGQLRLLDCYGSSPDAAASPLAELTRASLLAARELPHGASTQLLVAAMACSYLAAAAAPGRRDQAPADGAAEVACEVRAALGWVASPLLLVFALRRIAGARRSRASAPDADRMALTMPADACERSADARAA